MTMNSFFKSAALSLVVALVAPFVSAQVIVQNFSAFESPATYFLGDWELNGEVGGTNSPRATFSQDAGFYNFVGGQNDDTSAVFHFFAAPLDITGFGLLEVSARVLAGNTAPTFTIALFDSLGESAFATFSTPAFVGPGFFTLNTSLTFSPGFDQTDVSFFSLSGGVVGGTGTLNLALDRIGVTAVPEPATYGAIAVFLLVGLVALRRVRPVLPE